MFFILFLLRILHIVSLSLMNKQNKTKTKERSMTLIEAFDSLLATHNLQVAEGHEIASIYTSDKKYSHSF